MRWALKRPAEYAPQLSKSEPSSETRWAVAEEAVAAHLADLIAPSLPDLLKALDGRQVRTTSAAPAGIVLKGSGFYRTDSRAGGRRGGSRDKEPAKDGAASGNGSSGS